MWPEIDIFIDENNRIISKSEDIANELAKTFSHNSSEGNYQIEFQLKKNHILLNRKPTTLQTDSKIDPLLNNEIRITEIKY